MGGNAVDAAVATMIAVSVIQPNTCGIGGDCHALFYEKVEKKIHAINGRYLLGILIVYFCFS